MNSSFGIKVCCFINLSLLIVLNLRNAEIAICLTLSDVKLNIIATSGNVLLFLSFNPYLKFKVSFSLSESLSINKSNVFYFIVIGSPL